MNKYNIIEARLNWDDFIEFLQKNLKYILQTEIKRKAYNNDKQ